MARIKRMKTIGARVTEDEYAIVKLLAEQLNINIADILRSMFIEKKDSRVTIRIGKIYAEYEKDNNGWRIVEIRISPRDR